LIKKSFGNKMSELLRLVLFFTLISLGVLAIVTTLFILNLNKSIAEIMPKINFFLNEMKDIKGNVVNSLAKVDEMSDTVIKLSDEVKEIKERTFISMNNLDNLTIETRTLVSKVNYQADNVIHAIEPYKELVETTYEKFAAPINNAISIANAVGKAIKVFKSRFGKI
jgi:hypothetical protein